MFLRQPYTPIRLATTSTTTSSFSVRSTVLVTPRFDMVANRARARISMAEAAPETRHLRRTSTRASRGPGDDVEAEALPLDRQARFVPRDPGSHRGVSGRVRKSAVFQHLPGVKKWFECPGCWGLMPRPRLEKQPTNRE